MSKGLLGGHLAAESASWGVRKVHQTGGWLTVYLVLRAFASGCTTLTGVEAISDGVPLFKKPKSKNAASTLVIICRSPACTSRPCACSPSPG